MHVQSYLPVHVDLYADTCVNLTALDVFRRTGRPTPDLLAIGVAVHLSFLKRAVELTAPG
ncbi:MAG TPA: hypothetical protein VGJ95_10445 [Pseudonocardiaceae bacterium]